MNSMRKLPHPDYKVKLIPTKTKIHKNKANFQLKNACHCTVKI